MADNADRGNFRRSRAAVAAYFMISGMTNASFAVRLPLFKHQLRISDGTLGLVISAMAVGTLLALPVAGRLARRCRASLLLSAAGTGQALLLCAFGLPGNVGEFAAISIAFGLVNGILDVSMNTEAARLEARWERPLMSSFHACYSLAELAGAAVGAMLAIAGVALLPGLVTITVPLLSLALCAGRWLDGGVPRQDPAGRSQEGRRTRAGALRWRMLILLICVLAICSQVVEGAAADWSGVYLRDSLLCPAAFAASGYAAFTAGMMAGRMAGDRLTARLGPSRLARAAALLAVSGLCLALTTRHPVVAVAGFALLGGGLSVTAPLIYAAAGRLDLSGRYVARVVGASYAGLLGGPSMIGGLAVKLSLRGAFWVCAGLTATIGVSAGALKPDRVPSTAPELAVRAPELTKGS
jgi:fucose permease